MRRSGDRPNITRLLAILACTAVLAGCAGSPQGALPNGLTPFAPNGTRNNIAEQLEGRTNPIVGVYASEYSGTSLLNYDSRGKGNPLCSTSGVYGVYSIQSDSKRELIVPMLPASGTGGVVNIYKESAHLCLSSIPKAQFTESYGQPLDGFSLDGKTYYLAIARGDDSPGVAVCSKTGCTKELTNSDASYGAWAVTADNTGVYAVVQDSSAYAHLVYWKGAAGSGTVLSGWVNVSIGGLYFDGHGNLISIDFAGGSNNSVLYVYSGCPSACVAHGPFPMAGYALYGSLNKAGTRFMAMEENYPSRGSSAAIDVYQYNGTSGITLLYSNAAGLGSDAPVGIAQRL